MLQFGVLFDPGHILLAAARLHLCVLSYEI